ncbi:MAG: response regulator [Bacilli bacterium]|nr:response regulator [Bacilli bacterium]
MLYTMEFEIPLVCLLLILMLLFIYYSKPNVNLTQNKLFKIILLASLGEIFLDFIVHLICSFNPFELINAYPLYDFFNVVNKFIVIFFVMIFECLFLYVMVITYGKNALKNKKLRYSISILNIISLVSLMFTTISITNAKTASNVTGGTIMIGYSMIALYLTASMIITIINSKKIDRRYLPIILIFIAMIISYVVTLFFAGIILYDFVLVILCYLMYFTIENPDTNVLEEMHKAKEISDNVNEEKMLFLYNMTQEIKDTTNKINFETDVILESDSLEENRNSARNIKGETAKFVSMTNDILDVSKIDSANIKVYNSKYNIKTILKEVVSMYNDICKKKGITFRTNIEHNIPDYLYGDSIGMKKSLTSILKYCVGVTSKGYVELDINTIMKGNICRLIISIEDSSNGMKSDMVEKIKLEDKEISVAYKTIILMDGTMMILPNYMVGNKFKIILDQKMEKVEFKTLSKYNEIYENKKILVIDDSAAGIKIVEKVLKDSNVIIDSVNTGKDAIDKIKSKNKYDIILLDEKLSGISGVELLSKFREIRNFNIPVILLTKDSKYEYSDEYKNEGFDDYIMKPVKKEILLEKVDKFINK